VLEKVLREAFDVICFSFVIPVFISVGYLLFMDDISPSGQRVFPDMYIGMLFNLGDFFFFFEKPFSLILLLHCSKNIFSSRYVTLQISSIC